jgi:tRNA threonylcarbamoyl adenosine modification protein YeaZ
VLVLAFDTTSEQGGAAIYRDQQCLASLANSGPANAYSVTLFEMVERLLGETQLTFRDLELFAVAKGPGSFTGIRVGLAAAQGWASAFRRPVKGVSTLEALVEAAAPPTEWAVPILDARRGEFYLGLYRRRPGRDGFEPESAGESQGSEGTSAQSAESEGWVLGPEVLRLQLEEFAAIRRRPATCVVREHDPAAAALRQVLPASFQWQSTPEFLVGAIARLALRAGREGRLESPAELDACYVRRTDAELFFRKA